MPRNETLRRVLRALHVALHAENTRQTDRELSSAIDEAEEKRQLYSRREMLRLSLQAGAALPVAGVLAKKALATEALKAVKRSVGASDPMVIVGAGLAGLVAAYRLQKAGQRVELYEGGSRLGGRIFTKDRFNSEGMFCELGGELIDIDHKEVQELCRELGVPMQDLRPFDRGVEHDIFHFGGRVCTQRELIPAFRPMARHLVRDIKAVFPDGNVHMVTYDDRTIDRAAALRFDAMSLKEYLYSKTDVDRWVLEAIEVLYVCEYGLDAKNQSALNLLVLINPSQKPEEFDLLGDGVECLRVRGGNSRLVEELEKRLRARGTPIHLRHKLVRLDDRRGKLELTFDTEEGRKTVRAARAVLGLPFSTLRKVEGLPELGLTALKLKCIQELGYGTNTKFMTGYRKRPWRTPGATSPSPASRGNIVCDALDQSFWETSRGQRGTSGIMTNYLGGRRALDRRSPTDRLPTVLLELEALYPGMKAAFDGNTALFDWGNHELNQGSYVCPHPGQYTTLWGSAAAPELGGRLFFTGEHTSPEGAGFINGAVDSGNQVARQILRGRLNLSSLGAPLPDSPKRSSSAPA